MESFWATLKTECFGDTLPKTHATLMIFDYIETFHNRRHLHSSLGYRSPDEFERSFKSTILRQTNTQATKALSTFLKKDQTGH